MKQITEDYCSFEVAKLLKEKGFNEYCPLWYNLDKPTDGPLFYKEIGWYGHNSYDYIGKRIVSAPTHQMALKWLREVYNIHIEIRYVPDKFTDEPMYKAMIWDMSEEIGKPLPNDIGYMFYETCVNDAIKYTLENLI